jgi:hypothetical protein
MLVPMFAVDVRGLVDGLVGVDPACCDRDGLAPLVRRVQQEGGDRGHPPPATGERVVGGPTAAVGDPSVAAQNGPDESSYGSSPDSLSSQLISSITEPRSRPPKIPLPTLNHPEVNGARLPA